MTQRRWFHRRRCDQGFTLVELLVAAGVFTVAAAVAIPQLARAIDRYRVGLAIRDVERELQAARVGAVTGNRPVRLRLNCPVQGQFRRVEVLGDPWAPNDVDLSLTRCSDRQYPFPAADQDPNTRPNHDGPLRRLAQGVSFQQTYSIEFWPDGTARASASSGGATWAAIAPSGIELSVGDGRTTRRIAVNGMGRVQVLQ